MGRPNEVLRPQSWDADESDAMHLPQVGQRVAYPRPLPLCCSQQSRLEERDYTGDRSLVFGNG